jgi:hypothetical protein
VEVLAELMAANNLKQKDLAPLNAGIEVIYVQTFRITPWG